MRLYRLGLRVGSAAGRSPCGLRRFWRTLRSGFRGFQTATILICRCGPLNSKLWTPNLTKGNRQLYITGQQSDRIRSVAEEVSSSSCSNAYGRIIYNKREPSPPPNKHTLYTAENLACTLQCIRFRLTNSMGRTWKHATTKKPDTQNEEVM